MRAHRFPRALRARIKDYFTFAAEHGVGDHDARLIGGLSLQLQQDVLLSLHFRLLREMPFFAAQSTAFMLRIVQVLDIVAVPPGEFVLMQVRPACLRRAAIVAERAQLWQRELLCRAW